MKFIKFIGLICLICFTFIYTEKIIDVSISQDEIMIKLKEIEETYKIEPINATIKDDTIIPGNVGKYIDIETSYKAMKKIGYFEESLISYKSIYPEISIYNHYNKYIIKGNTQKKQVSLIYILNNNNTIDNILSIINNKNTTISLFIDSSFLSNNIDIIYKINNHEIYNYGNNGTYTKDNLIITNNIINNKSNNNSIFCLFIKEESNSQNNNDSQNNCGNIKMLSIIPSITGNYTNIKNNLQNGSIILINNTQELSSIIDYIKQKGYIISPLSTTISE